MTDTHGASDVAVNSPRVFLGVCTLAIFTLLSYGISGAAGQALFLNTYGSAALPRVWLAVALVSALSVAVINRFSARYNVVRLFVGCAHLSNLILVVLMAAHMADVPGMAFAIYVWKDIYIVVLVELFWTFANVAFGIRTASRTYGLYCAAGSIGTVVGSLAMKPLVPLMGTFHTLWLVVPSLWVAAYGCARLGRSIELPAPVARTTRGLAAWREGVGVLQASRYLTLLLIVVALVQGVIAITDYQYNDVIQATYAKPDDRTIAFGYFNAVISVGSFILQIFTGAILGKLGVRGTLLGIPMLVGLSLTAFVVAPSFATMAVAKVLGKSLDYSLFRAAKEILYIPLSYAEKTQGKALVDMLTYRVAKGGASVLLMGIASLGAQRYLGTLNTALVGAWGVLTYVIVRRYQAVKPPGVTARNL